MAGEDAARTLPPAQPTCWEPVPPRSRPGRALQSPHTNPNTQRIASAAVSWAGSSLGLCTCLRGPQASRPAWVLLPHALLGLAASHSRALGGAPWEHGAPLCTCTPTGPHRVGTGYLVKPILQTGNGGPGKVSTSPRACREAPGKQAQSQCLTR